MVLGILTTKVPESPTKEVLIARVRDAAQYIDIIQLCISGQCGFVSSQHGNKISQEDQEKKIRLLMDVAKDMWGEVLDISGARAFAYNRLIHIC